MIYSTGQINIYMPCKFKADNGKESKLFNELTDAFGEGVALKNWAYTKTGDFKTWFGSGVVDENGEPTFNSNNQFTNENGETESVIQLQSESRVAGINLDNFSKQVEQLTSVFERQGLNIDVKLDGDTDNIGSVVTINGTTGVVFNPRKVKKDSVFHEFGHLYVDMLGYDNSLIQRGIEHLQGTDLWNQVQRAYPELNQEKLGKEVLTTAIGIEAAQQFDERAKLRVQRKKSLLGKIKAWKFWVNHLFKTIGDKLGINQTTAKRLAYDLTSSNLRYTLTHKPASYVQKQKMTVRNLIKESSRLEITKDEIHYSIDKDPNRLLRRATTAIEDIKGVFDREGVLAKLDPDGKKFLKEIWADKREEGTGLHLINEQYIEKRNSGKTREQAVDFIMNNAFAPSNIGNLDKEGVRIYSGMNPEYIKGYVNNIADFLDTLYDKGYKLYPEVKVFDEELGVAGTIDLLIVKPNGTVMIYDFKTKEVGKFKSFHTKYGNKTFPGLASDVAATTANGYSLQLSLYKLILERKGFKVDKLAIIPFEGDIVEDSGEYRYTNVKLYSDHNTKADTDKVLPIKDLSQEIEDVFITKADVEEDIENIEEAEEELESGLQQISELEGVAEWKRNTIVNIQKSISRFKATATPETAQKYEVSIKDLLKELMVEDEMMAISAYTAYVTRSLNSLYTKFFDGFTQHKDSNGNTFRTYRKGFDSFTWQDIKLLEENEPKKYMEFLAFLINADMFLEQVVSIKNLPFTNENQSNLVLKALKDNESRVSDLQLKLKRLSKELDMRYVELSSNPLYGGRGVLQGTKDFFKAQADESFMQRHFDSLSDSHNSYMANVIKMYDYKMSSMQEDVDTRTNEWNDLVKELKESGSNLDRFVNKETGRVIDPIDTAAYYEERSKVFDELNTKYPATKGKRPKAWRIKANSWYSSNTIRLSPEETKALNKKMKAELGTEGFKEWFATQSYALKKGGRKYKSTGAYYKPNPKIWANKTYDSFSKEEKHFHSELRKMLSYLTEHMKDSIVKNGYLPSIPINNKSAVEQIVGAIGWRDSGVYDADKGVIVNEAGEIVHFLPSMYNNMLAQEKYEKVDPDASEDVKRQARESNADIKKANAEAHAAAINQDLSKIMPAFIQASLKHKHKKAIEFELLRVRKSFMDNHKVQVTSGKIPVIDKFKKLNGLENDKVEKGTIGSKTLNHYEDWLKMIFYEQFEKDEGNLQKVARVLQNYTSFKGMAFNILSGINNQVYGEMMTSIESAASEFFTPKDYLQANKDYWYGVKSYLRDDHDAGVASNKQSAIIHKFNILMDYTEFAVNENRNGALANRMLARSSTVLSKAYFMEHISEHNIQNRSLFAMMQSHKVIDGKIVKFDEYIRGKLKKIDPKAKDVKGDIARNKATKKKLKEDWTKKESLYDSIEFKEGKLIMPNLDKNELAEFERRVLGVNQYLHGIYNKEDAGAMQQYALGRLAIQFRKWMRPGWTKRFGIRMGEENWNERRSTMEEGIYVTTAKFLATPIIDNWKLYKDSKELAGEGAVDEDGVEHEAITFSKALGNIFKDYGRFLTNIKVHWHTLTDSQKGNVIRTFAEYASFTLAVGVLYMLKSIKGEDDDPPLALMLTIYQLDRTVTELTTYVPFAVIPGVYAGGGWLNESKKILKSPAATFNTMESIIKIGQSLATYPFSSDEDLLYQGGVYHGQNKLKTQVEKMIPIYNQLHRWSYLSKNYKYYKLF